MFDPTCAELAVDNVSLQLYSVQEGATIDAQSLSRIFKVTDGGALTLTRVHLRNGAGVERGGAIYASGTSISMAACSIADCSVSHGGGALRCYQGTAIWMGSTTLSNCSVIVPTGSFYTSAGGAMMLSSASIMHLSSCTISACTVIGTTIAKAGAVYLLLDSEATLTDTAIVGCKSSADLREAQGGAFMLAGSRLSLVASSVSSCTATSNSGAAYGGLWMGWSRSDFSSSLFESHVTIVRTLISGCTAISSAHQSLGGAGYLRSDMPQAASVSVVASVFDHCQAISQLGPARGGVMALTLCAVYLHASTLSSSAVRAHGRQYSSGGVRLYHAVGGGLISDACAGEILGCSFFNISATSVDANAKGAALYAMGDSNLTLSACVIQGCSTTSTAYTACGAFRVEKSHITLIESIVEGCSAASDAGFAYGGGMATTESSIIAVSSMFVGCSAVGFWAAGGTVSMKLGVLTMSNCTVENSKAADLHPDQASSPTFSSVGGALWLNLASASVSWSRFVATSSISQHHKAFGGALCLFASSAEIEGSAFLSCAATTADSNAMGGAISLGVRYSSISRSAVSCSATTFTNCTVANFGALQCAGGAVAVHAVGNATFWGCDFWHCSSSGSRCALGGACHADQGGFVSFADCHLAMCSSTSSDSNAFGGAIAIDSFSIASALNLLSTTFVSCTASAAYEGFGGCIYLSSASSCSATRCTFSSCTVVSSYSSGGALSVGACKFGCRPGAGATATLTGCLIRNSSALSSDRSTGGAIAVLSSGTVTLHDASLVGCQASSSRWAKGGAVSLLWSSSISMQSSTVRSCAAISSALNAKGGALSVEAGSRAQLLSVSVTNCNASANGSASGGGSCWMRVALPRSPPRSSLSAQPTRLAELGMEEQCKGSVLLNHGTYTMPRSTRSEMKGRQRNPSHSCPPPGGPPQPRSVQPSPGQSS